ARVGLGKRAAAQLHQRVGLLGAGRENAARAMVLEAASDQMQPVREQRRGERVAGIAVVARAVVGEGQRAPPVDAAAALEAMRLARLARVHDVWSGTTLRSRRVLDRARAGPSICGRGAPIA